MKKIIILLFSCISLVGCSVIHKSDTTKQSSQQNSLNKNTVVRTNISSQMQKENLNDKQKKAYDALYEALRDSDEDVLLTCTIKDLDPVFDAVTFDHPELFWVSYQYSYQQADNDQIRLIPKYTYNEIQIKDLQAQVDKVVTPVITKASQMSSAYDKVKYVYDYVIDRTTYINKEQNNQNMLSVFLDKEAVCAGYSKSLKYLLDQLGFENEVIVVQAKEDPDEYHVINLVKMDGEYYYLDPTFGDIKVQSSFANYRYAYFGMTSTEMLNIYVPQQPFKETQAYKDNYFYKEKEYLETYDESQIVAIIKRNLSSPNPCLSIKCKNKEVYEQAKKTLTSQHIFDLFRDAGYQAKKFNYYNLDENYCFFINYV